MKKLLLLFVFVGGAFLVHAQKYYAVKIADSQTEDPVNKANVVVKSTREKSVTGENGLLIVYAAEGDIIKVSCTGYVSQEATLSASSAVHVFLKKKPRKKKKH